MLALLYELQHMLAEIAGLPAVSLQPAAGAWRDDGAAGGGGILSRRGQKRTKVLMPDSAHGTNPGQRGDGRLRGRDR